MRCCVARFRKPPVVSITNAASRPTKFAAHLRPQFQSFVALRNIPRAWKVGDVEGEVMVT